MMTTSRLLTSVCAVGLTLASSLACSSEQERNAPETVGSSQAAVLSLNPGTIVEAGSPSPRGDKTCPQHRRPDQCGSWAGVALQAERSYDHAHGHGHGHAHGHGSSHDDEHCLCEPIAFEIPASLPVAVGNAGKGEAVLRFRSASKLVECRYEGNARQHGHSATGGDAYELERCTDGSRAGATRRADWFELELESADRNAGRTVVQLELGEPSVVGGEVQEQVFYSEDPRLPDAALYVPRGSAPAFETFSLEVVDGVPPGTNIPNAGDGAVSAGYVVDVRASSGDGFTFTPVPGAECPRIELPYDPDTLLALAGANGENMLSAQQLLSVSGIASGTEVLAPTSVVTVNLARHTLSFCVQHLSFYLAAVGNNNSQLTAARIEGFTTQGQQDLDLFTTGPRPTLIAGQVYTMTLTFKNTGSTSWASGGTTPALMAATVPTGVYPALDVDPLNNSTWGVDVWSAFSPSPVVSPNQATFTFDVTCPATSAVMNFCLRRGGATIFGDCFSWDPRGPAIGNTAAYIAYANGAGKTPVTLCTPSAETCNGIDDDCDAQLDNDADVACYSFAAGTRNKGICHDGARVCAGGVLGATCQGERGPDLAEVCGNDLDENCDGRVNEDCVVLVSNASVVTTNMSVDANNMFWYLDRREQPLVVEVKNTGTTTWDERFSIALAVPSDNLNMQVPPLQLLDVTEVALTPGERIEPGQSKVFNFIIVGNGSAPHFQWRMRDAAGAFFGESTPDIWLMAKGF
jgi:hypothetical protein